MKTFAERLRYAKQQAGMQQITLAQKVGCSKSAISQYLSGTIYPKKDVVERLANALGVTPEFLEGTEPEKPVPLPPKLSVKVAAECIGINPARLRQALRCKSLGIGCKDFNIGCAFPPIEEDGRWEFDIWTHKLREYVGAARFNEFFGIVP